MVLSVCNYVSFFCKGLKVAGQTTEFVNKVLEKAKLGARRGGLDEL